MNTRDKNFQELQAKWYKKLKSKGFDDIEENEDRLKSWASSQFVQHDNPILFEAKAQYYRNASKFLHDHKFADKISKFIWQQHSEGCSYRSIVKKLKEKKIKTNTEQVYHVIRDLREIMLSIYGLKYD